MGNQHGAPSSNPHSRSHSPASKSSNRGVGHLIFHSGHSKFNGAGLTTGGIDSGIGSKDPSESGSTHDNWDQNGHKSLPPIPDLSQEEIDKVSTNGIMMRSRRNSEGGSKGEEQSSSKRRSVIESEVLQQLKNRKLDLSHMLPESFRRGRRKSSDNNVPIEIKTDTPKVPPEECFHGDDAAQPRARASTISNGQLRRPFRRPALDSGNEIKRVSTVFRFTPPQKSPECVHIAGTMTNWTCVKMVQPIGEKYYVAIIPCLPRQHFFRFLVDGQWVHDHKEQCIPKDSGLKRYWNTMKVDKTDNEVFEALAVDSFALKDQRSSHPNDEDRETNSPWAQDHPEPTFYRASAKSGPPILPPHLLDVPLNKEQDDHFDPVLLPAPNHVSLQHLYAQSVRDNMLVLSATNRYKRRCITLLFYKPLMPESPLKKKPPPTPATS